MGACANACHSPPRHRIGGRGWARLVGEVGGRAARRRAALIHPFGSLVEKRWSHLSIGGGANLAHLSNRAGDFGIWVVRSS